MVKGQQTSTSGSRCLVLCDGSKSGCLGLELNLKNPRKEFSFRNFGKNVYLDPRMKCLIFGGCTLNCDTSFFRTECLSSTFGAGDLSPYFSLTKVEANDTEVTTLPVRGLAALCHYNPLLATDTNEFETGLFFSLFPALCDSLRYETTSTPQQNDSFCRR